MAVRELLLSWGMVVAYVMLNSFGALAIKRTIHQIAVTDNLSSDDAMHFVALALGSPLLLLGLLSIGVSACAWIVALSRMELSTAYPVAVSLNCLIVISSAILTYREPITVNKLAGIMLLFLSLVLMFRKS
jgi:multidrug transporter EmrE-like cation transporter